MSSSANRNLTTWLHCILIVVLCFGTRIPQLLSANLVLDSDECILALMAKHLCQGKGIEFFFTGQSYGFSLVESATTSLFYTMFGFNDLSVKLAMLSLWTAGVVFFYIALLGLSRGNWRAFFVTCVFIFCPAWAVWSMKARGGYLTAFMLSSVVLWLCFRKESAEKNIVWILIGALMVVIFFSQPLWVPGLLAILCWQYLHPKNVAKIVMFVLGTIPMLAVFIFLKHQAYDYWKPEVFRVSLSALKNVKAIPFLLYDHLHGYYYLENIFKASIAGKVYAWLFIVLMIVAPAVGTYRFFILKERNELLTYTMVAVLFTLGYTVFLTSHAPRYMLPLTGFVLLAVFVLLKKTESYLLKAAVYIPLIAVGGYSLWSFKDYSFEPYTKQQLIGCIETLEKYDAYKVFSNDGLLEWQIMYYSDEQIICRETDNKDRVPAFVQIVNDAYKTDCKHTATIDFYGDLKDMEPAKTIIANEKFSIVLCPSEQLLKDMEFQF